jgi:hypothetical protein
MELNPTMSASASAYFGAEPDDVRVRQRVLLHQRRQDAGQAVPVLQNLLPELRPAGALVIAVEVFLVVVWRGRKGDRTKQPITETGIDVIMIQGDRLIGESTQLDGYILIQVMYVDRHLIAEFPAQQAGELTQGERRPIPAREGDVDQGDAQH